MAQAYTDLETLVEQPDDEFTANLPEVIDDVHENLAAVLVEQPDAYDELSARMSTLDDVDEFATEHPEAVETFLEVLWDGMELITHVSPEVQEHVSKDFAVNWEPDDAPVEWHMTADPESGTVSGGPGLLDDPDLSFQGPAEVMFSMLNDDDFNGVMAFIQNKFEIVGSMQHARALDSMMDTVTEHMRDVEPEDVEL